jgi:enterochelin esterase family protein
VPGPTRRRMLVYLPKDYYENQRRYPVFYLLHGARGYETSWVKKGFVYETTDSLFRNGLATPCIVVMPNMNQYNSDRDFDDSRYKDAFESILEVNGVVETAFMHDVVGTVDSLYRTIPDKAHRALAGLSVGGYQSIWISANHPDTFGYVAAFSPYMWCLGKSNPYKKQFYSNLYPKLAVQFASSVEGYYLYAGEQDIMLPSTEDFHNKLNKRGYLHHFFLFPGKHDWPDGWIEEYQDMLQRVFKN